MHFDFNTIREIVVVLVPMILSLTVHEYAHAWSAFKLGDDTARSQGRMTLNPIAHIDILGTIIIPVFSVINGGISLIGWAKPVPVSPHRFNRNVTMHKGMLITSLAGPGSNLILALIFGGAAMFMFSENIENLAAALKVGRIDSLLRLGDAGFIEDNAEGLKQIGIDGLNPVLMLMGRIFVMNIFLAVFNMLPLPPLDGSRILPLSMQEKLARYTMIVFIGFLILINTASNILWIPVRFIGDLMLAFFGLFV